MSDITYLETEEGTCYLSLVTDAYSRRIMGFSIADNMEAQTVTKALRMAIGNRCYQPAGFVHHLDRGLQYCSREYVATEMAAGMELSMTEQGDPYKNALAERMNRTIKEEFCLDRTLKSKARCYEAVRQAVELYNNDRPHFSLSMKTPNHVHQKTQPPEAVGPF